MSNYCNCICDFGGEVWQASDHLNKMLNFKSNTKSNLKKIFLLQIKQTTFLPGTYHGLQEILSWLKKSKAFI